MPGAEQAYAVVRTTKGAGAPLMTVTGHARVGDVEVCVERITSDDVAKMQVDLAAAVTVLQADQK